MHDPIRINYCSSQLNSGFEMKNEEFYGFAESLEKVLKQQIIYMTQPLLAVT